MAGPGGQSGGGGGSGPPNIFQPKLKQPVNQAVSNIENQFASSLDLGQLALNDEQLPQRPGYGVEGKPVSVYANYVELMLNENPILFKYSITVAPKAAGGRLRRVIELLRRQTPVGNHPHFTDFKATLILSRAVPDSDRKTFNIQFFAEDEEGPSPKSPVYHVTVTLANRLEVRDLIRYTDPRNGVAYGDKEAMIHALNTILYHHSRSTDGLVAVGKKTFPMTGDAMMVRDLTGGLQVIRGFFASVRLATGRVVVNVNLAWGIFYKPGSLAVLMSAFGVQDKRKLERFLTHLRVKKTHLAKKNSSGQTVFPMRSICGLASPRDGRNGQGTSLNKLQPAPKVPYLGAGAKDVEFWFQEQKRSISVYNYFQSVLHMTVTRPELPVINLGSQDKPVYVPPELCEVPVGQHASMRRVTLNGVQTRNMLAATVRRPAESFHCIVDHGLQTVGLSPDTNTLLPEALGQAGQTLLGVQARVLKETRVAYANNKQATVLGASWNLRGLKLIPGQVESWGWVYFKVQGEDLAFQNPTALNTAVGDFSRLLNVHGIRLPPPKKGLQLPLMSQGDIQLENILTAASRDVRFLWVIVPDKMKLLYDRIKHIGDVKLGLTTVVSVDTKLGRVQGRDQYLGNKALKINLKLGGRNQAVDPSRLYFIKEGQTMVVGIDVTHPSTDQSKESMPSVASMVASGDRQHLAQWPAVLSVQRKRQEKVSDLKQMLTKHLIAWNSRNGSYPRRILIYRDGVSEGQYKMVKDEEEPQLRAACAELYTPAMGMPQMTIIIVAKRHHTRFAPNSVQTADRNLNCLPGTVIDRGITEGRVWNFFLQPHAAIKGTARPAFYTVVHDEIFRTYARQNKLSAVDICQDLTHTLCYVFGRATRAVGIATPAYYADIVCDRAACYLRALEASSTASDSGYSYRDDESVEITDQRRYQLQSAIETHTKLKGTMFYI